MSLSVVLTVVKCPQFQTEEAHR